MASNEWCEEQISKLHEEDDRIPILKEVKEYLTTIPREEITQTTNNLQLPAVFDCLNDSNSEQVDLACEVLSLCMNNLNLGESTNRYGVFLERALNHPFPAVKLMALTELERNIKNEDILVDLCKRESLLINIIKCAGDNNLTVAKKALEIIKDVGLSAMGIKQLISAEILKELHLIMDINEIVRFRVYEVLIDISVQSEANFDLLKSSGLLPQILNEIDTNDILLKLNVIELLSQLGQTKHGYDYLESNDILKKLASMLVTNDIITLQLYEPGILKFFGKMAHWKPMETLAKYPKLYQRIFDNIESDNVTMIGVSLDVLSQISATDDGKVALDLTGTAIEAKIKNWSMCIPFLQNDLKVRSLSCLESLLELQTPCPQMLKITQKWYHLLGGNPMDIIWNYAKNPFSELRLGGLGILRALAGQQWGQEEIRNYPGLVEFLLDRNIETVKECKEVKYEIVERLAGSSVFDQVALKKLQSFVKEGPFYVQAVMQVAIEGND